MYEQNTHCIISVAVFLSCPGAPIDNRFVPNHILYMSVSAFSCLDPSLSTAIRLGPSFLTPWALKCQCLFYHKIFSDIYVFVWTKSLLFSGSLETKYGWGTISCFWWHQCTNNMQTNKRVISHLNIHEDGIYLGSFRSNATKLEFFFLMMRHGKHIPP